LSNKIFLVLTEKIKVKRNLWGNIYRGEVNVEIKCKLKVILADKEIKHGDFAKMLKVNPGTISSWIRGASFPDVKKAYEVATLLEVSITDIWIKEGE
jgi:putative transcriptional regulator